MIRADAFSIFFHVVILAAAALCILGSIDYLQEEGIQKGEYYALVLFAAAGMGILAGANELVTAFIGLELSSISSYILAGFRRRSLKSNEASLKYFILGSFATAFFLYGIAMTYGATGTTRINLIGEALDRSCRRRTGRSVARGAGHRDDVCRPWLQSGRCAVPDLRPGRVRRRAQSGDGAARLRAEDRDVRADAARFLRGATAQRSLTGSGRSGDVRFSPCSSAISPRWCKPT